MKRNVGGNVAQGTQDLSFFYQYPMSLQDNIYIYVYFGIWEFTPIWAGTITKVRTETTSPTSVVFLPTDPSANVFPNLIKWKMSHKYQCHSDSDQALSRNSVVHSAKEQ